jgi:hypothetical protein
MLELKKKEKCFAKKKGKMLESHPEMAPHS